MPQLEKLEISKMQIHFILVEPAVPENVGAAARALKTMGFDSLRLVNPCEYKTGKARWLAHASGDILDNAQEFSSLKDAIKDVHFVIASSAKSRSVMGDHHPAENISEIIRQKKESVASVAIVFGREESGLTNSEISMCNISTYIAIATKYPSLNLSQAVMLYAYILSGISPKIKGVSDVPVAESKFKTMMQQVEQILENTKLSRNSNIYNRIFERLALLADNDINLLLSVIATLNEKKEERSWKIEDRR